MSDDRSLDWHRDWLALDDQRIRQVEAYCDIMRELERRPGWFRLSDAEKNAAQQLSGLNEAEAAVHLLEQRVELALRKMPMRRSRDYAAVLANLRVAHRLVQLDEHEIISRLLSNAVRDMTAIRSAS